MKFGSKKKEKENENIKDEKKVEVETVKKEAEKEQPKNSVISGGQDVSWVIINPRITEKTAFLTGVSAYTFNISPLANKIQVKKAIKEIYKVDPVKVRIVRHAPRKTLSRGRKVHKVGSKKAMVYLKEGDKIEFV